MNDIFVYMNDQRHKYFETICLVIGYRDLYADIFMERFFRLKLNRFYLREFYSWKKNADYVHAELFYYQLR